MTSPSLSNAATPESLVRITTSELEIVKGTATILHSINLTLAAGAFAAVIGPSGSGKTSLLRALASLDPPASGAITYCWLKETDTGTGLYPKLSYVPQTIALWPHMTFRQNLLFATDQSAEVNDRLRQFCDHLQLTDLLDRKPQKASQGQRQRFALVRAMLLEPIVLLCDEVTSALDEDLAATVWSMLRAFVERGGAILASTHDARLMSLCDAVYQIKHNSLIQSEDKR